MKGSKFLVVVLLSAATGLLALKINGESLYQGSNALKKDTELTIREDNPVEPHHRQKRWVALAVTAGVALFQGIISIRGQAIQRKAAEQAARQHREQMQFELEKLCIGLCVSEWTNWSQCTYPCGGGTTRRTRVEQTIGRCATLQNFQCPFAAQLEQEVSCNYGCHNGGSAAGNGICNCLPGWKGQCCQQESLCDYPGKPENGKITGTDFPATYRSIAFFLCNIGYNVIGQDYAICREDEKWDSQIPKCIEITCNIDQPNPNVVLLSQAGTFQFGEEVWYRCENGFKLIGPEKRKCETLGETGRLTGFNPICERVQCDDPGLPLNGLRDGDDLSYQSRITFSCESGYKLIGSSEIRCLASGKWLGHFPKCEQIQCEPPFVPDNGDVRIRRKDATVGTEAVFRCDPGYILNGTEVITCTSSGDWSDREPVCKAALCPSINAPLNGYKDGSLHHYPNNVTFSCSTGYILHGPAKIQCLPNGKWESSPPICKPCPISTYKSTEGDVESCAPCPPNTHTVTTQSTSIKQCLCDEGFFGPPGGPCEEILCVELTAPEFGAISQCDIQHGSVCEFTCDTGYIMIQGQSKRTCQKDGNWDGSQPICAACPINTFKSDERSCLPCPVNSHTTDDAQVKQGCVCDPGFTGPPGGPCEDVKECEENNGKGPCEDKCENTIGSYNCRCTVPGYEPDPIDPTICKLVETCQNLTADDAPKHGGLVCKWITDTNSIYCGLRCNDGYEFPSRVNNYELCGPLTDYEWTFRSTNPDAKLFACIEEYFPDVHVEADSFYFSSACADLTEEEKSEVKLQFAEILTSNGVCKKEGESDLTVCTIENMAIICGRTTRRRRRRGIEYIEESVDFNFNVSAIKPTDTKLDPETICTLLKIEKEDCLDVYQQAYKRYVKVAVQYAQLLMKRLFYFKNRRDSIKMSFQAARRTFLADHANVSELQLCWPGMVYINDNCVPCLPGTFHDPEDDACLPCPVGSYQPLAQQQACLTCPSGTTTHRSGSQACVLCDPGFSGEQCKQRCPCVNGHCEPGTDQCVCNSGWEGPLCDKDIDGCKMASCYEGVTCHDIAAPGTGYWCGSCPSGYTGDGVHCEEQHPMQRRHLHAEL